MAIQSRVVPVLLTRPEEQSRSFAAALRGRYGDRVRPVLSPLMRPVNLSPDLPPGPFAAVIFTSLQGVTAALPYRAALPRLTWCVGGRTAQEARSAGFQTRAAEGDAESLIAAILANPPPGRLLHLRGAESRGNVAPRLTVAGVPAEATVIYRQEAQPLAPAAAELLRKPGVVIVPLFSPRSAALFRAALPPDHAASLGLVAMSRNVADELLGLRGRVVVARRPDAEAMLQGLDELIAAAPPP
ncbi:uroporphyrinogen-III synthase [Tabrizicola soli]|uniref:Uroporphyrinogen-III synthase n=1 Tax=Tabrizicola soli TaxID=2185115 RepID=A0ABV7DU05_9RHOB|nr:uroporphyrinogen-III synthase [Tabrizicola soli]